MKNKQVIQAWIETRPAEGNSLSSDGKWLYSYNLTIGQWLSNDERPFIWNYTSGGDAFVSNTTSRHINQVRTELHHKGIDYILVAPNTSSEVNVRAV